MDGDHRLDLLLLPFLLSREEKEEVSKGEGHTDQDECWHLPVHNFAPLILTYNDGQTSNACPYIDIHYVL